LLDASASPDWEVTVLGVMEELDENLRDRNIELWLCALTTRPLDMLRRSDLASRFEGRLFPTIDAALAEFKDSKR
jgi:MFS superfamily sulfate permease-like transporter